MINIDKSGLVVLPCFTNKFTNKHTLQSNMAWKIHHQKCAVAPGTSMKGLPDRTAAVKTLVTGTSWKPILTNSGSRCQRVGSGWIHGAPPFQNGAIMVLGSPTVQRNNNAAIDILLLRYVACSTSYPGIQSFQRFSCSWFQFVKIKPLASTLLKNGSRWDPHLQRAMC